MGTIESWIGFISLASAVSCAPVGPEQPETSDTVVDDPTDSRPTTDTACEEEVLFEDADGDGWGGQGTMLACEPTEGWSELPGDCDDTSAQIHPDAPELCGGLDEDCDGLVDLDDPDVEGTFTVYLDEDGDGFGALDPLTTCALAEGQTKTGDDCDDTDPAVNPGAEEICEYGPIDEDCDGEVCAPITSDVTKSAVATWEGLYGGSTLGKSVVAVGDVNADGSEDVLVECALDIGGYTDIDDGDYMGAAYLLTADPGSHSTLDAPLIIRGSGTLDYGGTYAGYGGARLGDLDGDGIDDLLIATLEDGEECQSHILHGPLDDGELWLPTDADVTLDGTCASAGNAGTLDANGDGALDLFVPDPEGYGGQTGAFLYLGPFDEDWERADAVVSIFPDAIDTRYFAQSGTVVGDMLGTGTNVLAVGAPGELPVASPIGTWEVDVAGTVHLFASDMASGTYGVDDDFATLHSEGGDFDVLGFDMADAGDNDGDGYADLWVTAPLHDATKGAAYLIAGPVTGDVDVGVAAAKITTDVGGGLLGMAVAANGDVDADGARDVVLGRPYGLTTSVCFGPFAGTLEVPLHADYEYFHTEVDSTFGKAVTMADMDGDGDSEVAIGAEGVGEPWFIFTTASPGAVYIVDP